ncbi:hypothetical protein ACI1TM_08650 [Lactococcus garvieae]|uniref:hypothetical protein n=1 Tax=Lactococcus garvieae TaxID=1363 RepID=UPI003853664B
MNIGSETLDQILSSLKDYNPTAYDLMTNVSKALIPVALVVLATLMYMELTDTNRRLATEHGRMSSDVFIAVAWKYFAAFALVMLTNQIIDSFVYLNGAVGHIIDNLVHTDSDLSTVVPDIKGKLNMFQKMLLTGMMGMAHMAEWLAETVVKVLIFLRFFQLFIYKGAAPLMVSSYVSEEWRGVATGYMKQFIAIIIQGFVLVLILKLYPAIVADDMFTLSATGDFLENLAAFFLVFLKSGVFIFVLTSSQGMVKRWMGV